MSTKHTPGPWDIYPTFQNSADSIFDWITPIWSRADGICVGSVSQAGARGSAEAVANARLIAAAPDLLDALRAISREIVAWADEDDPAGADSPNELAARIAVRARAAIATAEGRDHG